MTLAHISDTNTVLRTITSPSDTERLPELLDTVVLVEDIAIALSNSNDFIFGLRSDGDKRYIGDKQ